MTARDGGTITYTYDGSLLKKIEFQGAVPGSIERAYDNNFRLISRKVNGENEVIFAYDNDGLLISAGSLSFARNAQNGFIQAGALEDVNETWTYSGFGEVDSYSAAFQTDPIYNLQFLRDKLGRVLQKTETIGGVTSVYGYTYDATGRLTDVTLNGTSYSSYTYDSNGNRLTHTTGITTVNGTYDAQDRLLTQSSVLGTQSYSYTVNGDLQTKINGGQTTTYNYDTQGNLTNVTLPDGTQVEYLIDGLNRRIGKKVNGSVVRRFLFYDQSPLAELDGSGNVLSLFVYAGGDAPAYMVQGGAAHRIITDHLGSVRLVVNAATGAVAQRIDYDEFGTVLNDTNPGFQPFGFAGGLYDQHTKLTLFGTRDYDAETGRWTSKDPIGFAGLDTNLYRYVFNDPVNWTDPSGLGALNVIGGIIAGVSSIALNPVGTIVQGTVNGAIAVVNGLLDLAGSSEQLPTVEMNPMINQIKPFFDTESLEFMIARGVIEETFSTAACAGIGAMLEAEELAAGNARAAATWERSVAKNRQMMGDKQIDHTQNRINRANKARETLPKEKGRLQQVKDQGGQGNKGWLSYVGYGRKKGR